MCDAVNVSVVVDDDPEAEQPFLRCELPDGHDGLHSATYEVTPEDAEPFDRTAEWIDHGPDSLPPGGAPEDIPAPPAPGDDDIVPADYEHPEPS